MQREIKFRVWQPKPPIMFGNNKALNILGQRDWIKRWEDIYGDLIFMQFTGLLDKNSIEIWEGDIVKWQQGKFECNYRIFWSDINGWWYGAQIRGEETPYSGGIKGQELRQTEVVGNLYENPELLQEKL